MHLWKIGIIFIWGDNVIAYMKALAFYIISNREYKPHSFFMSQLSDAAAMNERLCQHALFYTPCICMYIGINVLLIYLDNLGIQKKLRPV